MEIMIKIFESFWKGLTSIIGSPSIWILFIFLVTLKLLYPKLKGIIGEHWVKQELNKLSKNDYTVLNDIMLEDDIGTHQIDHLVISKYGIFVIEMKNYSGKIIGDEYKDTWIQYLGKNKYYFKNPIHQNYGHIKTLEKLLELDTQKFISIVCFSNVAKMKVNSKSIVVQLDDLCEKIKTFNNIELKDDISLLIEKVQSSNIKDKKKKKKHIKDIKTKIRNDKNKENNMICPKCGNILEMKHGRYGDFIGCSNYPNCRYIKKN